MTALFSPRASTVYRAVLAMLATTITVALAAPCVAIRLPYAAGLADPIEQPIAFDHRHHVRDDGIDCVYCHSSVETEWYAGLPTTERCMGCHGQVWTASPELERLRASWRDRVPIRWRRVDNVPAFVYFHHGIHIHAGLPCARCHGAVEDMPRVARASRYTMNFCLDCHREHSGGRAIRRLTTCTACHR